MQMLLPPFHQPSEGQECSMPCCGQTVLPARLTPNRGGAPHPCHHGSRYRLSLQRLRQRSSPPSALRWPRHLRAGHMHRVPSEGPSSPPRPAIWAMADSGGTSCRVGQGTRSSSGQRRPSAISIKRNPQPKGLSIQQQVAPTRSGARMTPSDCRTVTLATTKVEARRMLLEKHGIEQRHQWRPLSPRRHIRRPVIGHHGHAPGGLQSAPHLR